MKMHLIFHSLNVLDQTRREEFVKSYPTDLADPIAVWRQVPGLLANNGSKDDETIAKKIARKIGD